MEEEEERRKKNSLRVFHTQHSSNSRRSPTNRAGAEAWARHGE